MAFFTPGVEEEEAPPPGEDRATPARLPPLPPLRNSRPNPSSPAIPPPALAIPKGPRIPCSSAAGW